MKNASLITMALNILVFGCASHGGTASVGDELHAGDPTDAHDAVVAVIHGEGDDATLCTGTAIGPYAVVTARRCVGEGTLHVVVGDDARFGRWHDVESVLDGGALSVLVTRTSLDDAARVDFSDIEPDSELTVVGVGISGPGGSEIGVRHRAQMRVAAVREGSLWTRSDGGSLCYGDVGAALIDAEGRLLGVAQPRDEGCTRTELVRWSLLSAEEAFIEDAKNARPVDAPPVDHLPVGE